jgi:hypothetical protein
MGDHKFKYLEIALFAGVLMLLNTTDISALEDSELVVTYPKQHSKNDGRHTDVIELLRTVLQRTEKTDGPFSLRQNEIYMTQSRFAIELQRGSIIAPNVIWSNPTVELENILLPIRIPIRKGITGYRIFLIDRKNKKKFSDVKTVNELRNLIVGQGHDWDDVKVFRHNKFNVETATTYESLFKMLIKGRFDFFSRSISEISFEYESRRNMYPDLHIEENILLYYPWPKYFFVNKKDHKLADRLLRGFNIMIEDGSYDKWFKKYHQKSVSEANFKDRKLFKLINPLLPKTAPLNKRELWFEL